MTFDDAALAFGAEPDHLRVNDLLFQSEKRLGDDLPGVALRIISEYGTAGTAGAALNALVDVLARRKGRDLLMEIELGDPAGTFF